MYGKSVSSCFTATWLLVILSCMSLVASEAEALRQPDPMHYGLTRDKLFKDSVKKMKTIQVPWVVVNTKSNLKIYYKKNLSDEGFNAAFLQKFWVLDKDEDKLMVREKEQSGRRGWGMMQDFIYLPAALKDKEHRAYQKVVFTNRGENIELGRIGKVKFYQAPDESAPFAEKSMGTANFFYVYAWNGTKYEDSTFVLAGTSPKLIGLDLEEDERALSTKIYGWCKTMRVFPWDSRMALVPNKKAEYPPYIFNSGPVLRRFYSNNPSKKDKPEDKDILFLDPENPWKPGEWPFFKHKKFQDYVGLFIQLNPKGFVVDIKETSEELKYDSKSVDIVFVIDATKSMEPYIYGVSQIVTDIIDNIKKNKSAVNKVRFGAAVYRDYADGENVFEIRRLTDNGDTIKTTLETWARNAYSSHDDTGIAAFPEAVFHGISQTLEQAGFGRYNSKFLVIIGDAGNHEKDRYNAVGMGKTLAANLMNCIMIKVDHDLKGKQVKDMEHAAMAKFLTDANDMQASYVNQYSQPVTVGERQFRFPPEDVRKLFKIDRISNVGMLQEKLKQDHSQRITNFVYDMLKSYQDCINGAPIVKSLGNNLVININPIAYSSLKKKFGARWGQVVQEMIKHRAHLFRTGYAVENDPRTSRKDQFKNVFLYRESEIREIKGNLTRVLNVLDKNQAKNLWKDFIERVYGEQYDPTRTPNDYARMRGQIPYENLSELFDKPLEKILKLTGPEIQQIRKKVHNVYKKLKNLLDKGSKRFFGPKGDPYIWLYNEELP